MNILDKIPKKNEEIAWRKIDGEAVVIPLGELPDEEEKLDIFNETATRVWELIDGKISVRETIQKLRDEYDVEPKEVEAQVKKLINDMWAKKLIVF